MAPRAGCAIGVDGCRVLIENEAVGMTRERGLEKKAGTARSLNSAAASRLPAALSACLVALALTGCTPKADPNLFQGYIEGEYVYVAAPLAGALTRLHVQRGQSLKAGDALFELERESETAARKQAADQLAEASARLENLRKGKRPSEIEALEARLEQSKASLQLAETELKRVEKLYTDKVLAVDELDRARTSRDLYQAQVTQFKAEIATAKLPAREDEIKAAEALVEAAKAALARADWSLQQKSQSSPSDALVHDTLYRPGEWIAAGNPVISLLPPANLKVRFFVSQDRLSSFKQGSMVSVKLDGAPQPLTAKVNYISTQAEFTPPVIYSQQTRAKLVFMVEAAFDAAATANLHPGQPVDVRHAP
jgi:HlyD family secretion protein